MGWGSAIWEQFPHNPVFFLRASLIRPRTAPAMSSRRKVGSRGPNGSLDVLYVLLFSFVTISVFVSKIPFTLLILDLNSILDERISKCKEKGVPSTYTCQTCGKTMTDKTKMRRHVELHLDLKHFCTLCHKNFNTRNALSQHYHNHHGQNVSHTVL